MKYNKIRLLLFSILLLGTVNLAQTRPNKLPANSQLQVEYMSLVKKLDKLQKMVMKDSNLIKEGNALREEIGERMLKNDPSVKNLMEERESIKKKFDEAESQNNREQMVSLQQIYKDITDKIMVHQHEALKDPDLKAKADALDEKVKQKMAEIDPNTPQLIQQAKELKEKLQEGN